MTEAQFLFAIAAAVHGDHTTRSSLCRQLSHAFPLLKFSPGEGRVILEAEGVNGLQLKFAIVTPAPTELDASQLASLKACQPTPPPRPDPKKIVGRAR